MLFWFDSWDGYLPIIDQFPNLGTLFQRFLEAGWSRVRDFKVVYRCRHLELEQWKTPNEWSIADMDEECVELYSILAWSSNPKDVFTVASGYQELLSRIFEGREVPWCKEVWNNFSWVKCNCFTWTLALNRCFTWDNIHKRGFLGPSISVLCGNGEEDSSHLFFRCPFSLLIWHY